MMDGRGGEASIVDRTCSRPSSETEAQPRFAIVMVSSWRRMSSSRTSPSVPPMANPQHCRRPRPTASAPRARALQMSAPRGPSRRRAVVRTEQAQCAYRCQEHRQVEVESSESGAQVDRRHVAAQAGDQSQSVERCDVAGGGRALAGFGPHDRPAVDDFGGTPDHLVDGADVVGTHAATPMPAGVRWSPSSRAGPSAGWRRTPPRCANRHHPTHPAAGPPSPPT